MNAERDDDRLLLERWRAGDEDAGSALMRRHFASVVTFLRHRAGDDLEDLTQRTFLACVEGRDRIPDQVGIRAYLLGIARNQWLMTCRRSDRERRAMLKADVTLRSRSSPSAAAALHEEQRLLLLAMLELPEALRVNLELFYWENLKLSEIALVTDVAVGTVKSRLSRAKEALRHEIERMAPRPELGQSTIAQLDRWARSLARRHAGD